MYFTCTVLKSLMKIVSCEAQRKANRPPCKTCTKWEALTTDTQNIKSKEEVESAWVEAGIKEEPVKFDFKSDYGRLSHITKKGRHRYVPK